MLNFEKPTYKITEYIESNNYGKFEFEPLERGFGTTIGNALRRVMLSSMPGTSVVAVKIDGVDHEFSTIDGVIEDVTTIILNLKDLSVKKHVEEDVILHLSAKTEGPVTAGMIDKNADIEIENPDFVICNLAKGGKISMDIIVASARGYAQAEENKKHFDEIGYIPMDSNFSPVELVNYEVEDARVGQDNNYDKLIMSVTTNGSLKPEEAMALSAKILVEHLNVVMDLNSIADATGVMSAKVEDNKQKKLDTPIEELDFSVRAFNCLKRADVNTLGDLIAKSELEMNKIRNLGKKSLKEVIDKVKDMGLKFREED